MQTIAKSTAGSILLLAAIALITLFFRLGSLPLSGNDEPRYARIAEEMYESGAWVTPVLEDTPWLEKPPLYYWATIPFQSLFQSKETAARLGPALFAFFTALGIFWLGAAVWNRFCGLLAASILLTSLGFIGGGRTAATDMPFTCCLTLGLAILASAVKKDPGTVKILAAYVFLGLAVLGKGPVAVILAAGIGLLFWYLDDRGSILSRWRIVPGILVFLVISVPWFWMAFRQNGFTFINTFFINHNLARYVTEIHHHPQPFFFYIPVLLLFFVPWSGWLPFLVTKSPLKEIRRWRDWDRSILFLACWFLFPLLFFSLSGSKLAGYILPSLPPLSLMMGVRIFQWMKNPAGSSALRISMILSLVFSFAMAVAAPIYFRAYYGGQWQTGLILSPLLFLPTLLAAVFGFRGHCEKALATTLLQGMLIIVGVVQFAFPVIGDYLSAKDIAGQSLKLRKTGAPVYTYGMIDHSLNYYTDYRILGKVGDPASLQRLIQTNTPVFIVTEVQKIREFDYIEDISIELLGEQGYYRLLRLEASVPVSPD